MSNHIFALLGVSSPFDPSCSLVTSPVFTPFTLGVLRLTLAVYTLFTLLFILAWQAVRLGTAESFFSYFTELSYIGLCSYFFASSIQTLLFASRHHKNYPLQRWPRPLQFLHLLLFSTVTTFPILVTLVFWIELASSETFSTQFSAWSNISIHAMNTVFALFEITLTNAGPTSWTHIPFLIVLLAGYLGVAYITHTTQGFYTYSFLNPKTQGSKLAAWIVGIAVAGVVIFAITRTLCYVRARIVARAGRGGAYGGADRRGRASFASQATEEWETVERPESRLV